MQCESVVRNISGSFEAWYLPSRSSRLDLRLLASREVVTVSVVRLPQASHKSNLVRKGPLQTSEPAG
jgi:hypothetical protein